MNGFSMNDPLWNVIASLGMEFHPERVEQIADKIANMHSLADFQQVRNAIGSLANKSLLFVLESEWKKQPQITAVEIAAALRAASATASIMEKRESVEMVWTGPFTGLVPSRHTEQVLLEVVESARFSLFVVSFVAYDIDSVMKSFIDASARNVQLNVLLESSKSHGGKIDTDSIELFTKVIPDANLYVWNAESKGSTKWGWSVHAKCAVADGKLAFITSANLTRAAMENNMELGVLIRGGNLPENLDNHLRALITTGVVSKI